MAMTSLAADMSAREAERVLQVREALKQALTDVDIILPGLDSDFSDIRSQSDPYDGSVTLICDWRDTHNNLLGSIQVRENGQVFAEYDVIRDHPLKSGWFIEAVSAWGDDTLLRSELRLIPLP